MCSSFTKFLASCFTKCFQESTLEETVGEENFKIKIELTDEIVVPLGLKDVALEYTITGKSLTSTPMSVSLADSLGSVSSLSSDSQKSPYFDWEIREQLSLD
ncbi:unnamed protein product [Orchesella dallaii]|uniref:Uncharacterized protein n=1 Tax=Orchesella dallaii TaxID=48710 RepID=A0ABP1S771_9HEXA